MDHARASFDAGKKTRSCLILVDKLTLPRVAARGILWSLSMCSVDRRCAVSGYPIDGVGTIRIHAVIRNQESIDTTLRPFVLNHACHVWNEVPKEGSCSP